MHAACSAGYGHEWSKCVKQTAWPPRRWPGSVYDPGHHRVQPPQAVLKANFWAPHAGALLQSGLADSEDRLEVEGAATAEAGGAQLAAGEELGDEADVAGQQLGGPAVGGALRRPGGEVVGLA